MATYRLFPSTSGPGSSVNFSTPIVEGILFKVTQVGMVLSGYWYWRSDSAQPASAKFALWQPTGFGTGTLVANSTAATSSMVVGQWNYVPLAAPLALTSGTAYKAVVGVTGNFNDTANSFGTGGPYVNGIVNGPLTGFSAFAGGGGTLPDAFGDYQGSYDTPASDDPAAHYPASNSSSYNPWLDVRVDDFSVAFVSTDGSNVSTYNVTATENAGTQQMRVLTPTAPDLSYPHAFLWMLPVNPGQGTTNGDSIGTALSLNAHNQYNLTIIQPGYAIDPWFADNPGDATIHQETFTLDLVTWATANLATSGTEKHYLIGFSKSGLGGQGLLLRNPAVFQACASWDAPFVMTDYDGTDPNGAVGGSPAAVYGTSSNFTSHYELSAGNLTTWKNASSFGTVNRIWIAGYQAFQQDVIDYDARLTSVGIVHTFGPMTVDTHAWDTGWVAEALAATIVGRYAVQAFVAMLNGRDIFVEAGARTADTSVTALWPSNFTSVPPVAGTGNITGVLGGYLAVYPAGPQV